MFDGSELDVSIATPEAAIDRHRLQGLCESIYIYRDRASSSEWGAVVVALGCDGTETAHVGVDHDRTVRVRVHVPGPMGRDSSSIGAQQDETLGIKRSTLDRIE